MSQPNRHETQYAARKADVLAAVGEKTLTPSGVARALNDLTPCPWCPLGPPDPGSSIPTVPTSSREKVFRLLQQMIGDGSMVHLRILNRMVYARADSRVAGRRRHE